MIKKMYIYRADFDNANGHNVRFFYARNARIGKDFCRLNLSSNGVPRNMMLNKIGRMVLDVGSSDAAKMEESEEQRLIQENYGAGIKYAEREDVNGMYNSLSESDAIDRDT